MRSAKYYGRYVELSLLACVAVLFACTTRETRIEVQPIPSQTPPGTTAATSHAIPVQYSTTQSDRISLEEATQALLTLVDTSNDPDLKSLRADLSRKVGRSTDVPFGDYAYEMGWWQVRLYNRRWQAVVFKPNDEAWTYLGEFQKDTQGRWVAVVHSKQLPAARGGIRR